MQEGEGLKDEEGRGGRGMCEWRWGNRRRCGDGGDGKWLRRGKRKIGRGARGEGRIGEQRKREGEGEEGEGRLGRTDMEGGEVEEREKEGIEWRKEGRQGEGERRGKVGDGCEMKGKRRKRG